MNELRADFFLDPVPPEGWDQQETIVTYYSDPPRMVFHWDGEQQYSSELLREADRILEVQYNVKPMTEASITLYYWYLYQVVVELSWNIVDDPFQGVDFFDPL